MQTDILPAVFMHQDLGMGRHIMCFTIYFFLQVNGNIFRNLLVCRWCIRIIFYAIVYHTTLCITESHTVFGYFIPVCT